MAIDFDDIAGNEITTLSVDDRIFVKRPAGGNGQKAKWIKGTNILLPGAYAGFATPATNPGTPTSNVWYFLNGAGFYPNFKRIKTGTITTTSGSAAVVGVGTKFLTELAVGMDVYSGTTLLGTVQSITDDTHATLTANAASVVTGVAYNGAINMAASDGIVIASFDIVSGFWTKIASPQDLTNYFNKTDLNDIRNVVFPLNQEPTLWLANPNATFSAGALNALKGIKSVRIFNGSTTNSYYIALLCKADATFGYNLYIARVSDNVQFQLIQSSVPNPTGFNKFTIPLDTGTLVIGIDYSSITGTGVIVNSIVNNNLVVGRRNYFEADYNFLKNTPIIPSVVSYPLVTKTQQQILSDPQIGFPSTLYNFAIPVSGITATLLASDTGFSGKVAKLVATGSGFARIFEMFGIVPDTTKSLFFEFDYRVVSGIWKITAYANPGASPIVCHPQLTLTSDNKVRRFRYEITPAQLALQAGYMTQDYFSPSGAGDEIRVGNFKAWQGSETAIISGEDGILPTIVQQINNGTWVPAGVINYPLATKTQEQIIEGTQIGFPQGLYTFAPPTLGTATCTMIGNEAGFVGKVMKIVATANNCIARIIEYMGITVDLTKSIFIEFDYKVVSGTWSVVAYSSSGGGKFIFHPSIVLNSDGKVRRKRYEITPAQLATNLLNGYTINDYFSSSNGSEIHVGNFKAWTGNETMDIYGEEKVKKAAIDLINADAYTTGSSSKQIPATNLRFSFAGSSVTWGDGFLQTVFVKEVILNTQKNRADVLEYDSAGVTIAGAASTVAMTGANDRKFFDGRAMRINGVGAEIDFSITGDEISIVHAIERSNVNASTIQVYINGSLYDTFNNWNNEPMGTGAVINFTGDGTATKFDLGRAFTYNHSVSVAGVAKTGTLNTNGSFGANDYLVIRKYGQDAYGKPEVHHWLYFAVAPANGAAITGTYDYGEEISYERTTIGKNAAGVLESASGDGNVAFDILNATALSSGLDFRSTDSRAIKTYRFGTSATRTVRIVVSGLYNGATGTPYFIFNFATNRIFHFQNGGIGGWKFSLFADNSQYLTNFKNIAEFNPDYLLFDTSNNEDWEDISGHKLSRAWNGLSLTNLQSFRTLPLKSIVYNSGADTYDLQKWVGEIQAITERSVTIKVDSTHFVDTDPVAGDFVFLGAYYSHQREYIVRIVKSYDNVTKIITFDKPIHGRDFVFGDINMLVGMEVRVRSMSLFKTQMSTFIDNMRSVNPYLKMAFMVNPLPNIKGRDLWAYFEAAKVIADTKAVSVINIDAMYRFQYSQKRDSGTISINATSLVTDPISGLKEIDLTAVGALRADTLNWQVIINGINVYGKNAVVHNGMAFGVDRALTGAALNKASNSGSTSSVSQDNQFYPRLVFLNNAPTSGTITLNYSTNIWSGDSCHVGNGTDGSKVIGGLYNEFLVKY